MYREFIKRKFPPNKDLGMFVLPGLPATKLGKILAKETRIASPEDVVAFYLDQGFLSSKYVILTSDQCYFSGGDFLLEDVKSAKEEGDTLLLSLNHLGAISNQQISLHNEEAARTFAKIFGDLIYFDPEKETKPEANYEGFDGAELDWLKLRDEVMHTIDMLNERFNDGKISLLEFESKKEEMLNRL